MLSAIDRTRSKRVAASRWEYHGTWQPVHLLVEIRIHHHPLQIIVEHGLHGFRRTRLRSRVPGLRYDRSVVLPGLLEREAGHTPSEVLQHIDKDLHQLLGIQGRRPVRTVAYRFEKALLVSMEFLGFRGYASDRRLRAAPASCRRDVHLDRPLENQSVQDESGDLFQLKLEEHRGHGCR